MTKKIQQLYNSPTRAKRGFTLHPRVSSLRSKNGFTLIEIMVSVAIFTIIITSGIGALVTMTQTYSKAQKNKQVHQGLNYALETITREVRLGTNYQGNSSFGEGLEGIDGVGPSLRVTASDQRGSVTYFVDNNILYLNRAGAVNAQNGTFALTDSTQLLVDSIRFSVVGTATKFEALDFRQPFVWIQIQAHATGETSMTSVQTLVSSRTLDV